LRGARNPGGSRARRPAIAASGRLALVVPDRPAALIASRRIAGALGGASIIAITTT